MISINYAAIVAQRAGLANAPLIGDGDWRRTSADQPIYIATKIGLFPVRGEVRGEFGVHPELLADGTESDRTAAITHLRTGMQVAIFNSMGTALAVAFAISRLTDWGSVNHSCQMPRAEKLAIKARILAAGGWIKTSAGA